jgi:hypothetical protein
MIESYILLSEVLSVFKEGKELPEWFQIFARRFAANPLLFYYLDSPTRGAILAEDFQQLHADEAVTNYVGAVVRHLRLATHCMLVCTQGKDRVERVECVRPSNFCVCRVWAISVDHTRCYVS